MSILQAINRLNEDKSTEPWVADLAKQLINPVEVSDKGLSNAKMACNQDFDTQLEFSIKNYVTANDETLTFQLLFDKDSIIENYQDQEFEAEQEPESIAAGYFKKELAKVDSEVD